MNEASEPTERSGRDDRASGGQTRGGDYAERLVTLEGARWKRVLDVQRPYRWNLRRLHLGATVDVGCGIGRNLAALGEGSIGVDHNAASVDVARSRGFTAYTVEEFVTSPDHVEGRFDSALVAHVLEHVEQDVGDALLAQYAPLLRPGGRVVMICPQEVGYRTDATHVRFLDHEALRAHARRAGLVVEKAYSFPFVRAAGKVFPYNEFVLVARRPDAQSVRG